MAYTKDIALTDEIHIDGVDVSDAFRSFGFSSEREQVEVSGFNATGADEFLAGKKTDSFTGECFYTPEVYALLWPIYNGRTTVAVRWTPDGLADPTREYFYGNMQLLAFNPSATRGDVRVMTLTLVAADENGIQSASSS